ncbi:MULTISPECIES: type VI secretion system baseplate subunit TssK [Nitrospirillum]|uniref:Type VI secretion system protein ImpJ n=1 Tax=Nitrospirillum amazonense TaxID=28077 RepID=A0A560ICE4_9PROT|nr:type VI secretion system baseplate subunit TssK [Nitrospirillum amazonense]MDG3442723.1 type VI secretion system baseplate subunit TssK [Nitrospirillum amazonense]TWB13093.1 type VI secretion system protein ImpJ [Nitrospirillum amazonense]TWB56717.1 type VI secretion system protein ImpJ [Nitrospirillum amazonense]TWB65586.1 type VI secretion system protein ImpJ [Nitrospirillum amazonense]
MMSANRVVWTEGMFLRVQHFQQADRHVERLLHARTEPLTPFSWGLSELTINRELLGIGKFAIVSAKGILPDGTPFSIPDEADHPPPLELFDTTKNCVIYLTLPVRQPGGAEVGLTNSEDAITRFVPARYEAEDANLGSDQAAAMDVARLRLRLAPETQPLAGYEKIAIARVVEVRSDRAIILDEQFIAPVTSVAAQAPLAAFLTELQALIQHRAEALAGRLSGPSAKGAAEIADFLLLQTVNRYEPLLRHYAATAPMLHPERFYRLCVEVAGELATFTTEAKRAAVFPEYRHEDLQNTFRPVFSDLRASLSAVLEQTAVAIPLQARRHGIKVGVIVDRSLLFNATFVLAVNADMPVEHLRRVFPNQVKIGPVEQIAQLVNVALPGINVRPLPVAPRQLPYRSGQVFFELDRSSQHFKQLQKSGGIALHLAGDFAQIEMELWAIKGGA